MLKKIIISAAVTLMSAMAWAQPANDDCAGADTLNPTDCVSGTTVAAADNWSGNVGCQNGNPAANHPDVWYIFTATNTQLNYTVTTSGAWSGNVEFVLGLAADPLDPCNGGFFIDGSDCGASLNDSITGIQVGETYIITISNEDGGVPGDFTLCIDNVSAPISPGQDCTNPQVLCNSSSFSQGTVTGVGVVEEISLNTCFGQDEQAAKWYSFTVSCGGTFEMIIDPDTNTDDFDWALWNTTGGCYTSGVTMGSAIACNWSGCPGNTGVTSQDPCTVLDYDCTGNPNDCVSSQLSTAPPTLVAGETYTILIDNFAGNDGFAANFGGTATMGPNSDFTYTNPACGQYDFTHTCATPNSTFLWTFGDGSSSTSMNPSHLYTTTGIYTVVLEVTDALGCVSTNSATFNVNIPVATATPNPATVCSGNGLNIALTSTVGGTTWEWSAAANANVTGESTATQTTSSITDVLTLTGASPQVVNYTVTPTAAGCIGPDLIIPVTVVTQPDVDPISDTAACDSYTLPNMTGALTGNQAYYTGTGGTGTMYPEGATINYGDFGSYPVTLYAYDTTTSTPTCTDEETFLLTIYQTPVIDPIGPLSDCDSVQLPGITGILTGNEAFYSGPGATGTQYAAGDWISSSMTVYVYDSTTSTPSCSDEIMFTVTITGSPVANITPDPATVCAGLDLALDGNPSGGSGVYTTHAWTGVGAGSVSPTNAQTTTFNNGTAGSYQLIYTVTDNNGCTGADTVDVVVNPTPIVNATNDGPICAGEVLNLTEDGGDATTWSWTSLNGSSVFGTPTASTTTATGAVNGETFQVVVTDINGCSDSTTTTVVVNPLPAVNAINNGPICASETLTLTENGGAATTWSWTSLNGSAVINTPTASSTTVTGAVDGEIFQVVITDANGCSDSTTTTVSISSVPNVAAINDGPICAGEVVNLTENGGDATTWNWTSLNGSAVFGTPTAATTTATGAVNGEIFQVVVTNAAGCSDSTTTTVVVNPLPAVNAINDGPICAGETLNLTENGGAATTWSWTSLNGSAVFGTPTASTTTATGVTNGEIFQVVVTDANGCSDSTTTTVVVNPLPAVNAINNGPICASETLTLTENGGAATTWSWTSLNGSAVINTPTASTSTVTGAVDGEIFQVVVTDANGCSDSTTTTVSISSVPAVVASNDGPICVGQTLNLTESGGDATTWNWTSLNGSAVFGTPTASATTATGVTNGEIFQVVVTNAAGCSDSTTTTVVLNPNPTAVITPDPATICAGSDLIINGNPAGGSGVYTHSWTGTGAGSLNATNIVGPTFNNATGGNYDLTYTVTDDNGCSASDNITVTVYDNPVIASDTTTPSGCNLLDGSIQVTLTSGPTASGNLSWTGTTSGGPQAVTLPTSITGLGAGSYSVTFTDANGCVSNVTSEVLDNPGAPSINLISDTTACAVNFTLDYSNITGTNLTGGQAFYYQSGGVSPILDDTVFTAPTNITVYAYDNNGSCDAEVSFTIIINENPTATITPNPAQVCAGQDLALDGNPAGGSGVYTTQSWTGTGQGSLDNATIQTPTFNNATAGPYDLTYTVTDNNGCSASDNITVTVNALPVVSAINDGPICIGETLNLTENGGAATTWDWTSLNGTAVIGTPTASTTTATGVVNGEIFQVVVTDGNGCADSTTTTVTVNPLPAVAAINDGPICAGETVNLTENGGAATTWDWTSLNGTAVIGTPTASTTTATGVTNGEIFQVVVTDGNGCSDSTTTTVVVNPLPAVAAINDGPICTGETVNLTENGGAAATWDWTSLNGTAVIGTPTASTTTATGVTNGEIFQVVVTDGNGCSDSTTTIVVVNPLPAVTAINDGPICAGETVNLTENGGAATTWDWISLNGTAVIGTPTASTTTATGVTNGEIFQVVVTDGNGCSDSTTTTVIVNPLPAVAAINDGPICAGETVNLTENGGAATTWDWTSLNGTAVIGTPTASTTTATGVTNGEIFQVVVTDGNGCSDSTTTTVVVNPLPSVAAINDGPICAGETVNLTENGGAATTWDWTSLNGTAVIGTPTAGTTTATGVTTGEIFQVVVTDGNGCSDSTTTTVTVNAPPAVAAINDGPICMGATVNLTENGGVATTWDWTSLNGSAVIGTPTASTTTATGVTNGEIFQVVVTDGNGCTDSTTTTVTVNANPTASITPDPAEVCAGDDLVMNGNPAGGSGVYSTHVWSGSGAGALSASNTVNPTFNNATGGTYDLIYNVTDDSGCSAADTISVTVYDTPSLDPINDTTVCASFMFPIVEGTNVTVNSSYWTGPGATGTEYTIGSTYSTPGTITLYAYDGANGCSDEVSFTLTVIDLPTATNVTGGGTYCEGDVVTDITVDVTGTADWTISYTLDGTPQTATGSSSPVSLGNAAGVYVIQSVEDANCLNAASGTETIVINPLPLAPTAGTDAEYCSTATLDDLTASGNGGTFTWYSDAALTNMIGSGATFSPSNTVGQTTYYVTETLNGCEGPSSQVLITIEDCDIIIPSAFTPNNDGAHDDWEIFNITEAYPNHVVRVYNRWGNLLYESPQGGYDTNRWDGTYNGEPLPVASYYYIIEFNDEQEGTATGTVSIITNK